MAKQNKVKDELREFGSEIIKQVDKGKNPTILVPIRALSNVIYDRKTKTLMLGDKSAERSFFNVLHAKH